MSHPYIRLFPNKTVAPTVTDDESSVPPHEVGDWWLRITGEAYQCKDASEGAAVWETTGGTGSPGGSDTEIQFNSGGSFAGDPNLTWDDVNSTLTLKKEAGFATLTGAAEDDGESHGLEILGGDGPSGNAAGGDISLEGGTGIGSGRGGTFHMGGGNGGASGHGGSIEIIGGNGGDTTGSGGAVYLEAGDAVAGNNHGGIIHLRPGSKTGTGVAGDVRITDPQSARNAILDTSQIVSADRTFTFPNLSGTLALLSQLVTDHVNLTNKGTNTHAQIDTHLAAASPHSGHANKSDAPSWTNVTYLNSWESYGAGYPPLRYWKDQFGWVHLEGFILNGTMAVSAGNLPVGYRPSVQFTGSAPSSSTTVPGTLLVTPGGDIIPYTGANGWFGVNAVFYPA